MPKNRRKPDHNSARFLYSIRGEVFRSRFPMIIAMKLALINQIDTLISLVNLLTDEEILIRLEQAYAAEDPRAKLKTLQDGLVLLQKAHKDIEEGVLLADTAMTTTLRDHYTALVTMLGKLANPVQVNASVPDFRYSFASIPPVSWRNPRDSAMYITADHHADGPPCCKPL